MTGPLLGGAQNQEAEAAGLREGLLAYCQQRGCSSVGIAAVAPFDVARRRALKAIALGRMEGMDWYTTQRVEAASDIQKRFPWAKSFISIAWPYQMGAPSEERPGRMARYLEPCDAQPDERDYHTLLATVCGDIIGWLRERLPTLQAHIYVDHGWALDRAIAEGAGIGFCGKNAQLITPQAGSYVLLASIVVSVPLTPTAASQKSCGRCTRCIPACPTGAIVGPGQIDAPRCISYLTIEHEGPIPHELRSKMGGWIFGCDLCQEACPINERKASQEEDSLGRDHSRDEMSQLLHMSDEAFRTRFAGTAVERSGRSRLRRNVAIALGNVGDEASQVALEAVLEDEDAVVAEAAYWALGRLRDRIAPALSEGVAKSTG